MNAHLDLNRSCTLGIRGQIGDNRFNRRRGQSHFDFCVGFKHKPETK